MYKKKKCPINRYAILLGQITGRGTCSSGHLQWCPRGRARGRAGREKRLEMERGSGRVGAAGRNGRGRGLRGAPKPARGLAWVFEVPPSGPL
ncbi:hypothetical protein ACJIZ3_006929 [Penstemon smallii]|uniref:Uncharacterized protein n=1 Tax=Penstemon smallii TaxID=265156 RepID=A0ABD3S960_9LAMI